MIEGLLATTLVAGRLFDHGLSEEVSIPDLIERNWALPGIAGSADQALAGTDADEGAPFGLAGLFEFSGKRNGKLFLTPTRGGKQE